MAGFRAATAEQAAFLRTCRHGLLIETGVPGVYGRTRSSKACAGFDQPSAGRPPRTSRRRCASRRSCPGARSRRTATCVVPAPRRQRLLVRRDRARSPGAGGAGQPTRRLERVPVDDRPGPAPGGLLSRLPGDRSARAASGRWRDGRHRQCLGLPPRAIRRSGPAADVPHARAGPDRRPRTVAAWRDSWRDRATESWPGRARPAPEVASDPFFGRSGRMLAANQRAQELKFESGPDHRPGADGDRLVQLPPGPLRPHLRDHDGRWRTCPHRLPRVRGRAHHPWIVPTARAGPGDVAGRRTAGAVAVTAAAPAMVSLFGHDPATYRPHALHSGDRTYVETNCFTDILIELLHAHGDEPLAALGSFVRQDFEGDQWTFFKPSPTTWRRCSGSTSTRCSRTGISPPRSPSC